MFALCEVRVGLDLNIRLLCERPGEGSEYVGAIGEMRYVSVEQADEKRIRVLILMKVMVICVWFERLHFLQLIVEADTVVEALVSENNTRRAHS